MKNNNQLLAADRPVHDWYRFVLSFPPHLVRKYLETFSADPDYDVILDPFCGTGTTLIEAKKAGFEAIGIDANEMAVFASTVKTSWDIDSTSIEGDLQQALCRASENALGSTPFRFLDSDEVSLIPEGFISPEPLRKVLALRQAVEATEDWGIRQLMKLALADVIVRGAGNVGFGPEVYRTRPKVNPPVLELFGRKVRMMAQDLEAHAGTPWPKTTVYSEDARVLDCVSDGSVSVVITSPPYPNEKDYTRTTRLESVLLGLVRSKGQLRQMKDRLMRSNTRNVFKGDSDELYVERFPMIKEVAEEVERRRVELGKTSGFERLYQKVVLHYFGGMYRHLAALWPKLRPGGGCAYVVGDQMSYFRVPIRTGELLANIACEIGYDIIGRELWRTRRATVTGIDLREEVLLLRKPE